jgi:hypothetical protein
MFVFRQWVLRSILLQDIPSVSRISAHRPGCFDEKDKSAADFHEQ